MSPITITRFILVSPINGQFLAWGSFTNDLTQARVFPTWDDAYEVNRSLFDQILHVAPIGITSEAEAPVSQPVPCFVIANDFGALYSANGGANWVANASQATIFDSRAAAEAFITFGIHEGTVRPASVTVTVG